MNEQLDLAERQIMALVLGYRYRSRNETAEDFIRAAWAEATEAERKRNLAILINSIRGNTTGADNAKR